MYLLELQIRVKINSLVRFRIRIIFWQVTVMFLVFFGIVRAIRVSK